MANPTGSQNLLENSSYAWTDGDVYQIAQTDQQEGAATGASFSGLGVDNQPHQVLLNKAKLLRVNQVVDEANITTLLNFKSLFSSPLAANGYLKIGVNDVSRGQVQAIIQWGSVLYNQTIANDVYGVIVNWPIVFPNAFLFAVGVDLQDPSSTAKGLQTDWVLRFILGAVDHGGWELDNTSGNGQAVSVYGWNFLTIGY
jgi:hypothetical protein